MRKVKDEGTAFMNYAAIKKTDVANGPGIRVSLFVSGCTHRCKGCFNSEAWDFGYGQEYTERIEEEILEALAPEYIRGLSLLGGEPMEPENRRAVLSLVKKVRMAYPQKDIWCYTGYDFEKDLLQWAGMQSTAAVRNDGQRVDAVQEDASDLKAGDAESEIEAVGQRKDRELNEVAQLLLLLDVLVDGEFMEEKKNLRLAFRGSENQRLIDVQESLRQGRVVGLTDYS